MWYHTFYKYVLKIRQMPLLFYFLFSLHISVLQFKLKKKLKKIKFEGGAKGGTPIPPTWLDPPMYTHMYDWRVFFLSVFQTWALYPTPNSCTASRTRGKWSGNSPGCSTPIAGSTSPSTRLTPSCATSNWPAGGTPLTKSSSSRRIRKFLRRT